MIIDFSISSIVISLVPETISNNTFGTSNFIINNGESKAATIASLALFSPEETDDPIIAVPLLYNTVLASLKSIF
jgi:hypothetical protein